MPRSIAGKRRKQKDIRRVWSPFLSLHFDSSFSGSCPPKYLLIFIHLVYKSKRTCIVVMHFRIPACYECIHSRDLVEEVHLHVVVERMVVFHRQFLCETKPVSRLLNRPWAVSHKFDKSFLLVAEV